ncbi:MAG: hypothetical protein AVDCRST_MAG78-303 [uncultured Rubrobacteraceae bacterium]|uniref:Uncharacterized protein n=1 Tax=uncultured Rubrobacteraceae bacterium TaxID=349277 RepID=A0A6J4PGN1_9ACTN|nr:MAG: hypothetical protein AVDCRST_MAG78-303 [uncultured Rubrobacteraceae bacterium]
MPVGAPSGFVPHAYRRSFVAPSGVEQVWGWLNDPATFTEGQVWPFRVEFVDGGFEPGVLNVHHGPFLNVAGVIGEVRDPVPGVPAYRDLKYFYGSYAISPRLVRPTRLQFWVEETDLEDGSTLVTLQLDSLVRRPFVPLWKHSQRIFWSRFPAWMRKELSA